MYFYAVKSTISYFTMSELNEVFGKIKEILKKYEPPFGHKIDSNTGYDLWSFRAVEMSGRKYPELYFGGITLRGKYVSLYNMAIYIHKELLADLSPALKKKLSGKSCFHLTEVDNTMLTEIETLYDKAYQFYKDSGWI